MLLICDVYYTEWDAAVRKEVEKWTSGVVFNFANIICIHKHGDEIYITLTNGETKLIRRIRMSSPENIIKILESV